ncbi:SDR family NAD(P)-dependent oxidoreductase [Hyphococcus formosus]|uniref:SDR family NAD(P)-dependent oxidoreductase n=1 Tax=Hyphococcus formosus TaxID=3143534 RepID=UPI00398A89AC
MAKTIIITGATDGIGLATAKSLAAQGHNILLHGRNEEKLKQVASELSLIDGHVEIYNADLSDLNAVERIAKEIIARHKKIDVLINNAGVYKTQTTITPLGLDIRIVVNVIAPYLLTQKLSPLFDANSRIVNLSSAAQSPVDLCVFKEMVNLSDGAAYAQSKLALTMWSRHLAREYGSHGPAVIAVNPGSLLATTMVKDAYGVQGSDVAIGVDILTRAAISDEFADASGRYFDNDSGRFTSPHPDALDPQKCLNVVEAVDAAILRRPTAKS